MVLAAMLSVVGFAVFFFGLAAVVVGLAGGAVLRPGEVCGAGAGALNAETGAPVISPGAGLSGFLAGSCCWRWAGAFLLSWINASNFS